MKLTTRYGLPSLIFIVALLLVVSCSSCTNNTRSNRGVYSEDASDYYGRASSYYSDGEYEEAIRWISKAIDIEPTSPSNYILRAFSYTAMGDNEAVNDPEKSTKYYLKAITDYKKVLRLEPERPVTFGDIAEVYVKLGQYSEAQDYVNELLRIQPDSSIAQIIQQRIEDKTSSAP